MARFPWIYASKRAKTQPELPLEPPLALGSRSNGEYFHEQTARERLIRRLILERADENARRVGVPRRDFLASSMGMATSLWVVNLVNGCGSSGSAGAPGDAGSEDAIGDAGNGSRLPPDAMLDEGRACRALDSKRELVVDVQTHHVNPDGPWRRTNPLYASFLAALPQRACGETDVLKCFSARRFIEEIFLNSDTSVAVLSSVPAAACTDTKKSGCDSPLRNDEIVATRELVNGLAHSQRLLNHCMITPNIDLEAQLETMARLHGTSKVAGWKVYPPWGPSGEGWFLDDDKVGVPFIEQARKLGVKVICAHKGLPLPGFDAVHTDPRDVGVVAKAYPDVKFVVYHSGFNHGAKGGGRVVEGPWDASDPSPRGINSLIRSVHDNGLVPGPAMNVYGELGSVWGSLMTLPDEAAHAIGKLLVHLGEDNVVWGTDCIWTGSPQPQIEAFRAFQIGTAFQEKYGYPALTAGIKAKILGLNAAKIFGIDPAARRCAIERGDLAMAKSALDSELGERRWAFNGAAGPRTRREFVDFLRWNGGRPG